MTGLIHLKKYANEATKTGERKGSILEKSPEKSPTRGSLSGSPANNRASHSFKNGHKFIDPALLSKICTEKEGKWEICFSKIETPKTRKISFEVFLLIPFVFFFSLRAC